MTHQVFHQQQPEMKPHPGAPLEASGLAGNDAEPPEQLGWSQSIIVPLPPTPLDLERVAEAALPFARAVADRTGAAVVLLSVIDVSSRANPLTRSLASSPTAAEVQANLSHLVDALPSSLVDTVVRSGEAAAEILSVVDEHPQPLLVLTRHVRPPLDRLLFGSVTSHLVRRAPCPVLVVQGGQGSPAASSNVLLSKVVIPLDQSALAEYALNAGLAALGPADFHLHLLHVVEPLPYPGIASDEVLAIVGPKAREYLQGVAEPLLARGYRVTIEVRCGKPAAEIARTADEQQADLIVAATHGRSGFHRVLIGSVAERLLHEARMPLLLVRPDEAALAREKVEARPRPHDAAPPAIWSRPIGHVMSAPAIVAGEETPLVEIAQTMLNQRIGCVPIVDKQDRLVGIVTESDFVGFEARVPLTSYQVPRLFQKPQSAEMVEEVQRAGRELTAGQIMTRPVITASEDEPVSSVVAKMIGHGLHRVPVLRDGAIVGIVARRDLLALLLPEGINQQ